MPSFRDLPTFAPGIVGIHTRGADAVRLTAAIRAVPAAYPAAVALGAPFDRARRATALAILEALTAPQQAKVLAEYAKRSEAA